MTRNIGIESASGSCTRFIFVLADDTCISSRESRLKWLLVSRETRGPLRHSASDVVTNAFLTTYIPRPSPFLSSCKYADARVKR